MEDLIRRLDKPNIRVKTKDKIPQVLDWVNYQEKQGVQELLEESGEFGLRTGTRVGNYWFCTLDLDKKGLVKICEYLSYVKTKRGIHVYCLIGGEESPKNFMLYYQDERVGSFLGKGRQVIGAGSVDKKREMILKVEKCWRIKGEVRKARSCFKVILLLFALLIY